MYQKDSTVSEGSSKKYHCYAVNFLPVVIGGKVAVSLNRVYLKTKS